mmetsp:Transcript_6191/g.7803  ORF Transcript_6191/g.7803 Transcript_6191/m.7803 type:complete len:168 (+) Transcript_6191:126-629(+)
MLAHSISRALVAGVKKESLMLAVKTNAPVLSSVSTRTLSSKGYLDRQEKLGRPVSPHVMIYSFPLAAISSVTHRITGGVLTIGLYATGTAALMGADVANIASTLGSSGIGPLVKFSVAFPLIFHSAVGLRHFYWEIAPEGLNVETQYQMSLAIFGVSGLASVGLMFV